MPLQKSLKKHTLPQLKALLHAAHAKVKTCEETLAIVIDNAQETLATLASDVDLTATFMSSDDITDAVMPLQDAGSALSGLAHAAYLQESNLQLAQANLAWVEKEMTRRRKASLDGVMPGVLARRR